MPVFKRALLSAMLQRILHVKHILNLRTAGEEKAEDGQMIHHEIANKLMLEAVEVGSWSCITTHQPNEAFIYLLRYYTG
jgi:hypothetical protein